MLYYVTKINNISSIRGWKGGRKGGISWWKNCSLLLDNEFSLKSKMTIIKSTILDSLTNSLTHSLTPLLIHLFFVSSLPLCRPKLRRLFCLFLLLPSTSLLCFCSLGPPPPDVWTEYIYLVTSSSPTTLYFFLGGGGGLSFLYSQIMLF